MLYVFGGLPASGKSVLSKYLAGAIGAMHIRIDSIEQHLRTHAALNPVGVAGYVAAYAVAADNLKLGHAVVAESVNPITVTREAWRQVAKASGSELCEIEVVCSDLKEHKQRYLARVSDIEGLEFGPWESVLEREYEAWTSRDLVIDTAGKAIGASQTELMNELKQRGFA